jgi:hypothetical protein
MCILHYTFGSQSPVHLLPRWEDPSRHHQWLPPPPHLLLRLRGDGAPLEDSGSSSTWMPRWSSVGRVTHTSAASTISGSTQAFLTAVGLAASTRLGMATGASALAVLGLALLTLTMAVSPCRACRRGCGKSEVEAFELCMLLSQASAVVVSLWPCHHRCRGSYHQEWRRGRTTSCAPSRWRS